MEEFNSKKRKEYQKCISRADWVLPRKRDYILQYKWFELYCGKQAYHNNMEIVLHSNFFLILINKVTAELA